MTWPQALVLGTHAVDHQDVYFNLWRLRWVAHALSTSPLDLFNGNQFYPEEGVLAYSDAMLVEGLIASPMLWAGLPPVLVHNLLLLGAIVASAVGMFVLARHLSGSTGAAVVGAIVFAFAPYRFDHYMHMELQWTIWSPWAFWSLQRTIESGRIRFGLLTGLFVALQMMSSVYYGLFLAVLISVVAGAQLVTLRPPRLAGVIRALAAGGVLALALSAAYSRPYTAASRRVGTRHAAEVMMFSARPRDYRAATPGNHLYGSRTRNAPERRLFPGVLPPLLALVGLLLVAPTTRTIAYLIGLIVAFELSLGMYGELYPLLYDHVSLFRGLRAPARAAVFCLLFLGLLAAQGAAALTSSLKAWRAHVAAAVMAGVLLLEYATMPLPLQPYPNEAPHLYKFLANLPHGVVAEFPTPKANSLPGPEARYLYMSTFHWKPLLNGYSGYYPPRYLQRLDALEQFPDAQSVEILRADEVRYVVIHEAQYRPGEYARILARLAQFGLPHLGNFDNGVGVASVFQLR